ncbi:MAG TPA: acyl-CoA dehydrogenase family protein [Deltaproteobacteria bacterium]|nr:acyl-CoA dehydrogenase family protein [Deltaproteobacteria bacterium]HQI82242.1 acyl-CoA dehydrogenase family protein [Deltaproteobacteria bacterium]
MATGQTETRVACDLHAQAVSFARGRIAAMETLSSATAFPWGLWRDMGASGLLGAGVPSAYGGQGMGYPGIQETGRLLARHGRCLGMTLSWLIHQIVARFFLCTFATEEQRRAYLPAMAEGSMTLSVAISEPGVGGHPKHLRASARPAGDTFLLSGRKTFLTNGPIADAFIVLAVVGEDGGRKRYSAFVVPRGAPGLSMEEPMDVGFLRPCPHGGIVLEDCMVPGNAILGRSGSAYEDMALAFRVVEDVTMMGPVLGGQQARFEGVLTGLREGAGSVSDEAAFDLGWISSSLAALAVLAREAARLLEEKGMSPDLEGLVLAFRGLFGQVHERLGNACSLPGVDQDGPCMVLADDLDQVVRFAHRVSRRKQIRLGRACVEDFGSKA